MRLVQAANRAALIASVLSIVAYAVALPSVVFGGVGVSALVAAWWAQRRGLAARIPRWAINVAVIVALVYTVRDAARAGVSVQQIATLIAALMVLKVLDRRRVRDTAQVLALSVFLSIGAVLESVLLRVGVVIACYVPALVHAVMLHHAVEGHEWAVRAAANPWSAGQRVGVPVSAGPSAGRQLRRVALVSLGMVLVTAALVFVAVPRGIGEEMFGRMGGASRARQSGFAPSVDLSQGGEIAVSSRPVLHLEIRDERGQNLGSPDRIRYLRGNVLDDYDPRTGRWTERRRPVGGESTTVTAGQWNRLAGRQASTIHQRVTLLDPQASRGFLFALYRPVAVRFERAVELSYDPRTGRLRIPPDARGRFTYEVESAEVFPDDAGERAFANDASFPSVRIGALARSVLEDAGVPVQRRRTREEMLRTASVLRDYFGDFEYTLANDPPPADVDPTEWFIFESRRGHCEYFASALAAMCRSVGLPARVVTGYVAAEWNAASGHCTVRESNAHAWVEVSIGAGQWRRFDATPAAAMAAIHQSPRTWTDRLLDVVGAAEHWWLTYIVTFSQGTSRGGGAGEGPGLLQRLIGDPRERLEEVRSTPLDALARVATLALVGASLVAAGVITARSLGGRLPGMVRGLRRGPRSDSRLAWVYERTLRSLSRRGMPKPAWQPPLEFAAELGARDPAGSDLLRRVAEALYRARFAGAAVGPEACADLERRWREYERAR